MTGAVYPHLGVSEPFRNDDVARFGNDYQLAYAGNAYDMAVIISRLFNSADSLSPQDRLWNASVRCKISPALEGIQLQ